MKVITLQTGLLSVNCYIVYCEQTQLCAVIDPGGNADDILKLIDKINLTPKMILLTHGHFDHIGAVKEMKKRTGAMIAIHADDAECLTNSHSNLSFSMGSETVQAPPDYLLDDGDVLEIGTVKLTVIHTPGHTNGGITLKCDGVLFTGDTLFKRSVGRTDFTGGDHQLLMKSIREKLMVLDDKFLVYPGHGSMTTIGNERRTNPYLK